MSDKPMTPEQLLALLPDDMKGRVRNEIDRSLKARQTKSRTLTPVTARGGDITLGQVNLASEHASSLSKYLGSKRADIEKTKSRLKNLVHTPNDDAELNEQNQKNYDELHKKLQESIVGMEEDIKSLESPKLIPTIFTVEYQHLIDKPGIGPKVCHFGLEPQSIQSLAGRQYAKFLMLPEYTVFNQALKHLKDCPAASAETSGKKTAYPNNVVLVDILTKDKDGKIKDEKDEKGNIIPELHTVILWKTKDNEFTIIDPNNYEFSQHLAKDKILEECFPHMEFNHFSQSLYKMQNSPEKRDCIDIATKIGFVINEQEKEGKSVGEIKTTVDALFGVKKGALVSDDLFTTRNLFSSDARVREQYPKTRARSQSGGR